MKIVSNVRGRWTCATTCAKCLTQVELDESDLTVNEAVSGQPSVFEYACPICKDVRRIEAPKGRQEKEVEPNPASTEKTEQDRIDERQKERRDLEIEQARRRKEDRDRRTSTIACTQR